MRPLRVVILLLLAVSAHGATVTWTGNGDSNWSTAANWSSGTVPTAADDVVLPAATAEPIDIDDTAHGGSLTISGAYSLRRTLGSQIVLGSALTHSGAAARIIATVQLTGDSNWTVGDLEVWSVDIGAHTLTIGGSGTMRVEPYGGGFAGTGDVEVNGPVLAFRGSTLTGSIQAGEVVMTSAHAPTVALTADRVRGSGWLKSLTVTGSLSPGELRAEDVIVTGSGTPATYAITGTLPLRATTSMTLSNVELTFGTFQPGHGTSILLIDAGAQPVNGTFNGLPQGATFVGGGQRYVISYTAGSSGTDVELIWQSSDIDRTWTGALDGLWSNPQNWSPQGIPVDGDRLIFPDTFTVRALTNDLAPVLLDTLAFPPSAGPTSYSIGGNLLVLGGGTTGFATISAPVQIAANQTVIQAELTGTLDVGGHTVVLQRSHTGELVGTGAVVYSPFADPVPLVHPLNSFSGAISAGPPFVSATLAGSYPNASITEFWQLTVEGEQTVGDADLETLALNHPAGDAYGLLHTGSLVFTIFPTAVPIGNPARWYLDIDADSSDRLDVTGTVTLLERAYLDMSVLEPLTVGTVYTIVENDGTDPVSGIFGGPAEFGQAGEGALLFKDGHFFRISYLGGDGNDVTLTVTAAPPAQVSVSGLDTNLFEGDSGTKQAEVVINMNRTAASDVTVTYHTADRTAQAGLDYAARSGTFVIPAGQTSVILNIPVLGDINLEDNETFAVILDAVSQGTISDSEIIVGILDDDEPHIALTAEDASVVEGDFGIATVNVTLTLTEPATQSVNVQYHTEDGAALAGSDYNTATGAVTIPAGATSANITLTVIGDGGAENDETFTLVLDSAGDLQIVRSSITITILDDDPAFARVDDIVYSPSGETLDLLLPVGNTRKIPAVVAFIDSADEPVVARQTARGYAVLVVSVRDRFPANLEDALAAVAWLRAHAHEHHIDATRIAAWGIGAGGNLAALLGTNAVTGRTHVDAAIDFYGETDFLDLDAHPGSCGLDYTPFFGCDPGVCRDTATAASPLEHVTPDDEPFLIVHATGDCVVPVAQSVRLHHALQADGVHSELVTVPGNRGPNVAASPTVVQTVDAFLDEMLGKGKPSRRRSARH